MPRADENEEIGRRFRALIDHLGVMHPGKARGWQARVAKQLGIKPPNVTQILNGERTVGIAFAHRVAAHIGLDARYFTDEHPDDWIVQYHLAQVPIEQRKAFQLDLAGVRQRGRELARMAREAPDHPRLVAEALRAARDLLESTPVQTARELSAAAPKAQPALAARFADSLLDSSDPFDRAEADPGLALEELDGAVDRAMEAFIRAADARGTRKAAERRLAALVAEVTSEARAKQRRKISR